MSRLEALHRLALGSLPPPSDLTNSLIGDGPLVFLLSSFPRGRVVVCDVAKSLFESSPVVVSDWRGDQNATCVAQMKGMCMTASGRRVVVFPGDVAFTVRYDVKTASLRRNADGKAWLATGGPRGVVVQTVESGTRVLATLWQKNPARLVRFSESEYLLVCSGVSLLGIWRTARLTDECAPDWELNVTAPKNGPTCCAFAGDQFFCVSFWYNGSTTRPTHFVYRIDKAEDGKFSVHPHEALVHLSTGDLSGGIPLPTSASNRLPPPSLCTFSRCSRFLAVTSAQDMVSVWNVQSGELAATWKCDAGDEIVGLCRVDADDVPRYGVLSQLLMIRTAKGVFPCFAWPYEERIERDCPWMVVANAKHDLRKRELEITILAANQNPARYFPAQYFFINDNDAVIFYLARLGDSCLTVIVKGDEVKYRYENVQPVGSDRCRPFASFAKCCIKLENVSYAEDDDVLLTFRGFGPHLGLTSTLRPKADVWRFST